MNITRNLNSKPLGFGKATILELENSITRSDIYPLEKTLRQQENPLFRFYCLDKPQIAILDKEEKSVYHTLSRLCDAAEKEPNFSQFRSFLYGQIRTMMSPIIAKAKTIKISSFDDLLEKFPQLKNISSML